jgi:hypothetical protein
MSVIKRQRKGDCEFWTSLGKISKTLYLKQNKNKRAGSITQVLENLEAKRSEDTHI